MLNPGNNNRTQVGPAASQTTAELFALLRTRCLDHSGAKGSVSNLTVMQVIQHSFGEVVDKGETNCMDVYFTLQDDASPEKQMSGHQTCEYALDAFTTLQLPPCDLCGMSLPPASLEERRRWRITHGKAVF